MKFLSVIIKTLVFFASFNTLAAADFQCILSERNQEPFAVIYIDNLPSDGNLTVTQEEAYILASGYEDYKFSATVENNEVVGGIVISKMRLENSKLGVFSERSDLTIGQLKTLSLGSQNKSVDFECFLNN